MMQPGMRHSLLTFTAPILLTIFACGSVPAQTHVVSPADLQKEAAAASQSRRRNLDTVHRLLTSPKVADSLAKAGIDPARVETAVAALSDRELADLAVRSEKAQADFAAGRLSDRDLIVILIGLVALILIIVAVH